eukprot:GHVU01077137.1.p1 GENE.GHVU01077137.1~~GHVU01077137.1.p1  ORF type:complete len:140 (-),score=7.64 GHVU01077137.1:617-1036(-)
MSIYVSGYLSISQSVSPSVDPTNLLRSPPVSLRQWEFHRCCLTERGSVDPCRSFTIVHSSARRTVANSAPLSSTYSSIMNSSKSVLTAVMHVANQGLQTKASLRSPPLLSSPFLSQIKRRCHDLEQRLASTTTMLLRCE